MDEKLERLPFLIDRVLTHLDHEISPETEIVEELRQLSDQIRLEGALEKLIDPRAPS
jgi:hypothetical protein